MTDSHDDAVVPVASLREYFRTSVDSALDNQSLAVADHTACYVVNLLTTFARADALYEPTPCGPRLRPLATLLAEASDSDNPRQRGQLLRRLGDVALFIAGCFAESLDRRAVDVDYYIAMGGSAYRTLSDDVSTTPGVRALNDVFDELSAKFHALVNVLAEIHVASRAGHHADVLRLYALWQRTGSRRVRRRLERLGVHPIGGPRTRN